MNGAARDNLRDIDDVPNARSMKVRYLKAEARLLEALGEEV